MWNLNPMVTFSGSVTVDVTRLDLVKISGLSNQWKSRDGLFRRFAQIDPDSELSTLPEWTQKFTSLIHALEGTEGPDIFIGSSLSCMNFNNRDAKSQNDNVPSFAYLEILDDKTTGKYYYRIEKRRIANGRPTDEWLVETTEDPALVARHIRNAVDFADVPVRKLNSAG